MIKYHYLCFQNLWSSNIYIYSFQINVKPKSLSWAGCDFQTVDCLWNISTWHPPDASHTAHPTSPPFAFSILGNGFLIFNPLLKHKSGSFSLQLPDFWELPSEAPSFHQFSFQLTTNSVCSASYTLQKSSPPQPISTDIVLIQVLVISYLNSCIRAGFLPPISDPSK